MKSNKIKKAPKSSSTLTPPQDETERGCSPGADSISEGTMYSVDNGIYTELMRATTAPNCNLICRNYAPRFEVRGSLKIKQFDGKSLLHFFPLV